MISLRPYQEDLIMKTRLSLARSKHTLIILPTGGGKTILAAFMALGASLKDRRIMFTCHRDFLLDQTSEAFSNLNIPHSFVAPGRPYNTFDNVIIASVDTLKRRYKKIQTPDILIVDEAIHAAAAGWSKIIKHYQNEGCMTIGLCACSERSSGEGLGQWFKEIVIGPSMEWLIENGYLSKYKIFAPQKQDLSKIKVRSGEYAIEEISDLMNKPSITGCAIDEYKKIASGKQGVAFCCSIEHSRAVCAAFNQSGFSAVHIGADTKKPERKKMLQDFRNGKIKILTAVDIFSEGFDLPAVEYAALLRPTKSLNIFLQQIGRVLRAHPGKEFAYISDHANNVHTFGLPDEVREWTLEDRKKKKRGDVEKSVKVMQCEKCYHCAKPFTVCPNCGHEREIQGREVEQISGNLVELKKAEIEAIRRMKKKELVAAKTYDELVALGTARQYKYPVKWAEHIMRGRSQWKTKQPSSKK